MKLNNKYYIIRHGEAQSNINRIISSWPETFYNPLTSKGIKQVKISAKKLEKINFDLIFSSDLTRAKQTAEILADKIDRKIKLDKRLREYNFGELNGTFLREFTLIYSENEKRFLQKTKGGENYNEMTKRMFSFFSEINKKYFGKVILIVSHQVPLSLLLGKIQGLSNSQIFTKYFGKSEIANAQIIELK